MRKLRTTRPHSLAIELLLGVVLAVSTVIYVGAGPM